MLALQLKIVHRTTRTLQRALLQLPGPLQSLSIPPTGTYRLLRADVEEILVGCLVLWFPGLPPVHQEGRWLLAHFPGMTWIAVEQHCDAVSGVRLDVLRKVSAELGIPLVAGGDVHMHVRERCHLQDSLTAIRMGVPISLAGFALYPNGERYLRERQRLARLYPQEILQETVGIAQRCTFSLDELRYEYPREVVPEGETPTSYLRRVTEEGARRRWPQGIAHNVRSMIEHEFELIADLRYEPYFLTVYDVAKFARQEGILCQGRGRAVTRHPGRKAGRFKKIGILAAVRPCSSIDVTVARRLWSGVLDSTRLRTCLERARRRYRSSPRHRFRFPELSVVVQAQGRPTRPPCVQRWPGTGRASSLSSGAAGQFDENAQFLSLCAHSKKWSQSAAPISHPPNMAAPKSQVPPCIFKVSQHRGRAQSASHRLQPKNPMIVHRIRISIPMIDWHARGGAVKSRSVKLIA